MYTLEINGKEHEFSFGMGFVRDINKRVTIRNENGVESKVGLNYAIAALLDHDIENLAKILLAANAAAGGSLTMDDVDKHFEDPDTDIKALSSTVLDFFKKSNCTALQTKMLIRQAEKAKN